MAALTKDKVVNYRANAGSRRRAGRVAANTVIFLGALIARNAAGFIVPASDSAAIKVVGIAEETIINNPGGNGAKEVKYITGVDVELENAGGAIVQASDKSLAFVADDQSVTTAAVATNDCIAGIVTEFTSTKVWTYVDEVIGAAT